MKGIKHSLIFLKKTLKFLVLQGLLLCFLGTPTLGNFTVDSVKSSFQFNKLLDIAYGLTDIFDLVDRKTNFGNINNKKDQLLVLGVGLKDQYSKSKPDAVDTANFTDDDSNLVPEILRVPLVYPNPFRQSIDSGAILSYFMNKDFSVEIQIYNMMAQCVFKQSFESGALGARKGENRLRINRESLGGYFLSSGVYFYLLIHSDKVLAKGKMVVKP